MIRRNIVTLAGIIVWSASGAPCAAFDLVVTISNPTSFTPPQLLILEDAIDEAEQLWESVITGYQAGITIDQFPVAVTGQTTGFGNARVTGSTTQGGFNLATRGVVNINRLILEEFSNFEVDAEVAAFPGQTVNVIDDLVAHEIGHALGIGTKWSSVQNGVRPYTNGTGRYTGAFGLAAYREEFNLPDAQFVPVELAGGAGTPNAHWDQLMRSGGEAGVGDPFELDPRLGIVDDQGRDLSFELMTGAIDPDWGEPFLSRTTVQSLRDIGFTVVPEPAAAVLLLVAASAVGYCRRR